MLIVPTRHEHIACGFAGEVLLCELLGTASSRGKGSAAGVGSSSEHLGGSTAFVDFAFATSAAQTFTRPFCLLRVLSSVGGTSRGFVRHTYSCPRGRPCGATGRLPFLDALAR